MPTVLDVSEEPVVLFGGVNGASTYEPVDITTRTVVFFGRGIVPDLVASPQSIAPSVTFGDHDADQRPRAEGIGSGVVFGVASTIATVAPTGVASTTTVGQPRRTDLTRPTGIAASDAAGSPSTIATVQAGSAQAVNLFGQVSATKKGWIFRPSVNTYKWRLFKEYEGISLLKENGVWSEVAHPDLPRTKAAERYLAGGRDHVIGDALKAELEGLGYTVTEEFVTTEEYL